MYFVKYEWLTSQKCGFERHFFIYGAKMKQMLVVVQNMYLNNK